ncbi:MAG TPA: hypothetical protein VJ732_17065 [Bryobacteraceae bacterium]|nr:hypothetical protein [Bryobacteraceae bacterium]
MWRHLQLALLYALAAGSGAWGKTVVFWETDFPAIETEMPSQDMLARALRSAAPQFRGLSELRRPGTLNAGDLLVLPYGSAFPADAWEQIRDHLTRGNLLVLGGRPLTVPVWREPGHWRAGRPQFSYSRLVGVAHTLDYPAPAGRVEWDEDHVPFEPAAIQARRMFVLASDDSAERRRGLAFFINSEGDRIFAPVIGDDVPGKSRRVFLPFEPAAGYWESRDGQTLLREAASYAAQGPVRLSVELQSLALDPGDHVSGTLEVRRRGTDPAAVILDLLAGGRILASSRFACGPSIDQPFTFPLELKKPGVYTVRAALRVSGRTQERYLTGFWVRDKKLLESGATLQAGRDYFRLRGKPYLPVGVNYFSTDPYTSFFTGGSLGGNAWQWERDFASMEAHGVTFVRTGVWQNRARYLDPASGRATERFLRAVEAYLDSAARHHMQVVFTFFAFEPQALEEPAEGQAGEHLGPGSNPYTDPVAIRAEQAWVESIAGRFKDVPFLSFDLINEPTFSNPERLWKGNSPEADPTETAAWHQWLARHYPSPEAVAEAWRVPRAQIGPSFSVPLPTAADLTPARSGNRQLVRAIDFNLFAQDAFHDWAAAMIGAIRDSGARQAITIGQDEGGVTDRVLNQFYGDLPLAYTVNHTWWRDDALLWDSIAAKRPDKPNLVGETGPQPAWSPDGSWRWDEATALPLLERKLALGFAAGNAGSLQWDWARGDTYGILRRDGSFKPWVDVLSGIARFAQEAGPFATAARRPDIAIVLPQSLQLSALGAWAVEAQQKCVRALYGYARQSAFAVGEYQLNLLGNPKLIIVPAPWILRQDAWAALLKNVEGGATLLISGRIDADEHFWPVTSRTRDWPVGYQPGPLTTRENLISWPGGSLRLSYGGSKTTYAERGILADGSGFLEQAIGKGRLIYFALPLEFADELDSIGQAYRYAIQRAGIAPMYQTDTEDPGILICPTELPGATLYVITSESSNSSRVRFRDEASGAEIECDLPPGRAALALVRHDGVVQASYRLDPS